MGDAARREVRSCLGKSNFEGMMNYYKANYPGGFDGNVGTVVPEGAVPVLQFHGLEDTALHHYGLSKTRNTEQDYTLP